MKNQRGFTLAEVAVTIVVTAVLASLLGVVITQMIVVPDKGADHLDALHDLQNAVSWIGSDVVSAESASGGGSLTLTLPDSSVVTYEITGTDLWRNTDGGSLVVADSITDISFTVDGRLITMDITSTPGGNWGISESRTYMLAMRVSG